MKVPKFREASSMSDLFLTHKFSPMVPREGGYSPSLEGEGEQEKTFCIVESCTLEDLPSLFSKQGSLRMTFTKFNTLQ